MALWQEDDYGKIADKSCWSMFAVLTALIGLRVFCRFHYGSNGLLRGLGVDDAITVFCWLLFLVTCILITSGTRYGLGRHMGTLEPEQIVEALRYNVIVSSVLIWVFSLPKFAIVALLKRILDYGPKTATLFWGLALTSQACILATSVWWFKQCSPVERGWNQNIEGSCSDTSIMANLGYFTSAYSAFLDIFFALYPIPLIMRLNMRLRSRVTISTAMGLSALACVVSIYKLAIFGQVFTILPTDPTYPVAYLDILGMAEGFILLVCASLPTLGPLFQHVRGMTNISRGSASGSRREQEGRNQSSSSKVSWHRNISANSDAKSAHQGAGSWSVDEIPLVTSSRLKRNDTQGFDQQVKVSNRPEI